MTLAALFPVMVPTAAFAAPVLTLEPITWNVVGLDSNSVASGPNVFPVGVRVCNTGDATATNVQADFVWDTANGLINLSGATSVTNPQLPAGSCADFNFDVVVTRSAAAYDTVRRYHINVTADGLGTLSTPQPREIYVEHLVSQNRNDIDSISGPSTVEVGGTYTFTLVAKTATNGYEQIENFLTFPNLIFRVDAVSTTYSAPVGGTNDAVYADACGWDNDPGSATYRQCIGPEQFPGAKAGGDLTTVFTVTILSSGSATLTSLIYDFSGSSFHYNSDFGLDVLAVTAVPSADLSITKADAADPVLAGDDLVYTLSVNNAGPSDASNLTVTDNLPPGTSFVSASGLGWTCNESSGVVTCTRASLAAGASAPDITLTVTAPSAGGNITNSASVASSTADPSAPNNSAAEQTTVTPSVDLALGIDDSPDPVDAGSNVDYTVTVTNNGPSDATNLTVTNTVPVGTTFVSSSGNGWSCSESSGTVTCTRPALARFASAPDITITVTAPPSAGTITDSASVSATESDPDPGNDSDSEDTAVQDPPPPPPNNPPVATDDVANTTTDTPVPIGVTANDTDADGNLDPSTVQVTVDPPNGSVTCDTSGVCTYTPDPGFSGPDSFDYQVCDTDGACDTATVNVTVDAPPPPPPNNPPVATDDVANTTSDTPVAIGVTANDSDPDGNLDPSTVQVTVDPPNGSVTCDGTGVCTYTPDPGFSGPDSFEYQVCDTDGACDTATVNVTVDAPPPPPNSPPVATDDLANTTSDTSVAIGVTANDSDPDGNLDPSTVQVTVDPPNGSVTCDGTGVCTYTPDPGFSGPDSFEYQVCDTDGACDTATVNITVTAPPPPPPVNNPPVATDDVATTAADTSVPIGVTANDFDPDGNLDPSTAQITVVPPNGSVTCAANGVCTYTPDPGFSGPDSFEYQVCDTDGACDTATVNITVSAPPPPPNNPPVATDDVAITSFETPVAVGVSANDTDPDGNLDPSTVQVTSNPSNGSVSCANNGVCTYTPDPGFSGSDSFEYEVCDTNGACDGATVTVTVDPPPNNPPVATDDTATTTPGTAVAIGVIANDTDADGNLDPSTVKVTSNPSNGTVTCDNTGICTYTPDTGFTGTDSFEYEICDTDGACDTATVTVTVSSAPTPNPAVDPEPTPTPAPGDGGGGGNGGGSQDEDPAETEVLSESRTAAVEMVSGTLPFTGRAIDKLLLIAAILLMTGSTCLVLSRFSSATERDRGFWGRRKPRYYGF